MNLIVKLRKDLRSIFSEAGIQCTATVVPFTYTEGECVPLSLVMMPVYVYVFASELDAYRALNYYDDYDLVDQVLGDH